VSWVFAFSADRACTLLAALHQTENYLSFRELQLTNFNLFETFGFTRRSRIYFTDSSSVNLPLEGGGRGGGYWNLQNCSRYQTVVTANCLTQGVNVYTDIVFLIRCPFFLTFCWPCISVINQLDAQHFCSTISFVSCLYMFRAHLLIIRRSKLHYTASGIITPVGGRPVHSPLSTCAPNGHLQVWWHQMLCNAILTPWWWAHSARNKHRHKINLL